MKIFLSLFFLILSFNHVNAANNIKYIEQGPETGLFDFKGELNEENCSGSRKLRIETKYVSDFRVDLISMDYDGFINNKSSEYCDESRIILIKNSYESNGSGWLSIDDSNIVFDKFLGTGANAIPRFLNNQEFILNEYVWFEVCGMICGTYGFYLEYQKKPIFINDEILQYCDVSNENTLECSMVTDREFNTSNPNCSRSIFPYDTFLLKFTKDKYIKETISQMPIPKDCM